MDLELRSLVAFASGLLLFPVLLIGAVGKPASFVASIWRVREFDFLNVTFLWRQRKPPLARLRSMTTGFSLLSAEIRHFYLPTTPNSFQMRYDFTQRQIFRYRIFIEISFKIRVNFLGKGSGNSQRHHALRRYRILAPQFNMGSSNFAQQVERNLAVLEHVRRNFLISAIDVCRVITLNLVKIRAVFNGA